MSTLQIGLAIVGGLVLAAVLVQGAWTVRKNRPRQARTDVSETAPQLAAGIEPELDVLAFDGGQFPLSALEKRPALDALIDSIAPIFLESAVSGEAVLAALPGTRRVGSKPFSIEGFNDTCQRWEMPLAGQRYMTFQAGVQLANRSGALNEIEYSEFVMKTQLFCDAINGTPDFPEMLEEVTRARELDQFASEHDAQLGFMLRARSAAWSPGYIQQNAVRLGFVAGSTPGRLIIPASMTGTAPMLVLSYDTQAALADDQAQSAVRELVLSLDVAQVARTENAYSRMRAAALSLADSMEGVVTDDNGLPLLPAAMDAIGAELEHLYDTLDEHDLSAGSALARRLFS